MKIIVKYFSEIFVKSRPVRRKMVQTLQENVEIALHDYLSEIKIKSSWANMSISFDETNVDKEGILSMLEKIAGIHFFLPAYEYPFVDFEDTLNKIIQHCETEIEGKRFCVRVKRSGKHDFKSTDLERFLGGGLLRKIKNTRVDLHHPEKTVIVEIQNEKLYVVEKRIPGRMGFPIGTQGKVLSLISGGFDSCVSSYLMMNKGCKVDYLFFNLGGNDHEKGVKEIVKYLSDNFSHGYHGNIFCVPFNDVVEELHRHVHPRYHGVVLKRMMIRMAEKVQLKHHHEAIVTGESLAQVASQTLTNLAVIQQVATQLIMRPVLAMQKEEIIHVTQKIDTEKFSRVIPEYCGISSHKPSTKANLERILEEEEKFDMSILDELLEETQKQSIKNMTIEYFNIPLVSEIQETDNVIDIHENEQHVYPFGDNIKVEKIAFIDLLEQFPKLPQDKNYIFYCEKGQRSKHYAEVLSKQGFENIKVFEKSL
ncbi:tRNA 4-thiouridine(8) synthase ThiI [Candidatus Peregrinibacteria bacterium]|nr:MAG: tRNA 4-thiouridine(8) synthase ThiI [Candidatus Peregrinibacteria bacterium]